MGGVDDHEPARERDPGVRSLKDFHLAQGGIPPFRRIDPKTEKPAANRRAQPVNPEEAPIPLHPRFREVAPALAVVADLPNISSGGIGEYELVITHDLQEGADPPRRAELDLPPPGIEIRLALPGVAGTRREPVLVNGA